MDFLSVIVHVFLIVKVVVYSVINKSNEFV